MNVANIIKRVRLKITDEDKYRFSDDDVIIAINEAIRFVNDNITSILPELIAVQETGSLEAGENTIEMDSSPTRILEVRIGKDSLHCINLHHVSDTEATGRPEAFVILGAKKLKVYPIPNKKVKYEITFVPAAMEVVEVDDEISIPDDFIDSVIEFTSMRLSLVDEFDQTMETQLMTVLHDKIQSKLAAYAPANCFIRSYW